MKVVKIKPFKRLNMEVRQGIIPDYRDVNRRELSYYGIDAEHINDLARENREIYIDGIGRLRFVDNNRVVDVFIYTPCMYTVVREIKL